MIPLWDENPTFRRPVVVPALIALNVAVFLYEVSLGPKGFVQFTLTWGVTPARFFGEPDPTVWLTPLTSMFMHGSVLHILSNMWFLHVFGDNVEDVLGRARFVAFYLVCGLGAVLAQGIIDPSSTAPMVGASGAIAGVLAGYVRLHPRARILALTPFPLLVPAFLFIFVWFALQVVSGFVSLGRIGALVGSEQVAFFAHIGGFLAGFVLVRGFAGGGRDPRRARRAGPYVRRERADGWGPR